jgi:hypothetical protein
LIPYFVQKFRFWRRFHFCFHLIHFLVFFSFRKVDITEYDRTFLNLWIRILIHDIQEDRIQNPFEPNNFIRNKIKFIKIIF